ncbi:phospholipase D-like domain-containing protein [Pseudomonas indica]|uniref:phospholipase D-like domain-containing protein n=1 Tax=Pseudomonas indica TaxID=137658 RepID=UPI0023F6199C|nr:phospholipase D-like domain-containing protein [Pseudomonas indica]MBU3057660.1 nuclease [Pseudomonas indica]
MDFAGLDQRLLDSLVDLKLSNEERDELRQLGNDLGPDQVRYLRNRAFDLVRELAGGDPANMLPALKWLEQVVKTLDLSAAPTRPTLASAHFSPGEDCLRKIRELCRQARSSVDICVYTISDDRLSDEIVACHRRGVAVRVISDNEKQYDEGSDIQHLIAQGVPLRIDDSPFHMHHKFALFDRRLLLNGSFNWTRAASTSNEENLLVIDHPHLVAAYGLEFGELWARYANL